MALFHKISCVFWLSVMLFCCLRICYQTSVECLLGMDPCFLCVKGQ
uniref:Uncharacterized protein n=2 Tax=Anguilla anguilla TaxID=7936 RepID=A0A0E9XYB6_ANGAN